MHINVYSKPGCHLCEDTLQIIDRLSFRYALDVTEVNILDDMSVYEQYREIIPVVVVTDVEVGRLVVPITEADLHGYFARAQDEIAGRLPGSATIVPRPKGGSWLGKLAGKVGRGRAETQ